MTRLLLGPVAVLSCVLAAGFAALAVVAALSDVVGMGVFAALMAVGALVVLVLGLRTAVWLGDEGLHVLGDETVAWADVVGVTLQRRGRGLRRALPVLSVAEGRAVREVQLDGLLAGADSRRLARQTDTIASRAHVILRHADAATADSRPSTPSPRRSA